MDTSEEKEMLKLKLSSLKSLVRNLRDKQKPNTARKADHQQVTVDDNLLISDRVINPLTRNITPQFSSKKNSSFGERKSTHSHKSWQSTTEGQLKTDGTSVNKWHRTSSASQLTLSKKKHDCNTTYFHGTRKLNHPFKVNHEACYYCDIQRKKQQTHRDKTKFIAKDLNIYNRTDLTNKCDLSGTTPQTKTVVTLPGSPTEEHTTNQHKATSNPTFNKKLSYKSLSPGLKENSYLVNHMTRYSLHKANSNTYIKRHGADGGRRGTKSKWTRTNTEIKSKLRGINLPGSAKDLKDNKILISEPLVKHKNSSKLKWVRNINTVGMVEDRYRIKAEPKCKEKVWKGRIPFEQSNWSLVRKHKTIHTQALSLNNRKNCFTERRARLVTEGRYKLLFQLHPLPYTKTRQGQQQKIGRSTTAHERSQLSWKRHHGKESCFKTTKKGRTLKRVKSSEMISDSSTDPSVKKSRTMSPTILAIRKKQTASHLLRRSIVHLTRYKIKKAENNQFCKFFNLFGKCKKGETCQFLHDPERVAVCTRFLQGRCTNNNCLFSHKLEEDKLPTCSFFLRASCSRENCPYTHVKVNRMANVCKDFTKGFCSKGKECKEKHFMYCEEYELLGSCAKGKHCELYHRSNRHHKRRHSSSDVRIPKSLRSSKADQDPVSETSNAEGAESMQICPTVLLSNVIESNNAE